ncbi:Short-chain dehydrogenase reductase 3b [Asimina triloba]
MSQPRSEMFFLDSSTAVFFYFETDRCMCACRLQGKVAIITGGASGIGEASARLFADNGAQVVIADVQDELGRQVAASIGPGRCCYVHCDVRDEKQVEAAVALAVGRYGRVDVMFSNAGVAGPVAGILELRMEELEETMATNVRGAAAAIKHAARAMVAGRTRGSIVCTGSVASCVGGTGPHAYTASKHALVGLVRSAAAELGAHGIRVNCVSPFGVATPLACGMGNWQPAQVEENCTRLSNLKGIVLKPRHVADAALFLASDDSAYVSGHNLVVDGGFTVVNHADPPPPTVDATKIE